MADSSNILSRAGGTVHRYRSLLLPAAAVGLLLVLFVPLPSSLLDVLLVANITLGAIILLTTINVRTPMEFSIFPTVLLASTLLRLVLNVATTRLILTSGADGRTVQDAQFAAGHVVWTFGNMVALNSLTVGLILLAMLIVIQFVVVTRGAGRISEVAARFMLDAMPGKQMAIDADLNAKLITPAEAMRRRRQVSQEADFYGAMDGASKFLRGDAIAAVLITLINLIGGVYVGLAQYGWDWTRTVDLFSRLTIGEGLVMQIPAFLVAVASAVIITRSTSRTNLSEEFVSQLACRPVVLLTTAAFLGLLMLTSLPTLPLLLIGGGCAGVGIMLSRRTKAASNEGQASEESAEPQATATDSNVNAAAPAAGAPIAQETPALDPISVEIGYSLVGLTAAHSKLLDQVSSLRQQIAAEFGLVVPPVRIRDNMNLDSRAYVIRLRGTKVAEGTIHAKRFLAVAEAGAADAPDGTPAVDPVSGATAVWITPQDAAAAQDAGYHLLRPAEVLMGHLNETLRRNVAGLLTRQQVAKMLDDLKARAPGLVQEVLERFKPGAVQKVLQALLRERVPLHDMETILEALSDWPGETGDLAFIVEHVRGSLAGTISQQHTSSDGKLWCVSLPADIEDEIAQSLEQGPAGEVASSNPELIARLIQTVGPTLADLRSQGRKPVVLCSPGVRRAVAGWFASSGTKGVEAACKSAALMAYNEVDSVEVQTVHCVGIES